LNDKKEYMLNLDVVVIVIILANVIVSLIGFKDFSFKEKYKFSIGGVRRGEQIRMISSGFLHADEMHLFFNMFTLYFFAPTVVRHLGNIKFLGIYFGSLLVGNILSLFFHKDEYHYNALGASGAVSGVLFSAILLEPERELGLLFIPFPIPPIIFGFVYLLFSIFGMKNKMDNIGHDAHFGGASCGYLMTLIFVPSLFKENLLISP